MADWFCGSVQYAAVTQWAAATAYSVGDIRRQLAAPTAGNERCFRCTTAGTSGGAEPSWTLTKGGTTNDNTVVWTEVTGDAAYNTLGGTWSAPHARMRNAASWMAAGDRLLVMDDHAATEAASVTITFPGTHASPNIAQCVTSGGAVSTGASETTTGGSNLIVGGFVSGYGFTFSATTGVVSAQHLGLGNASLVHQRWTDCKFISGSTGGNAILCYGGAIGSDQISLIELIRPTFKFGSTSQKITIQSCNLVIQGGSHDATGSEPAYYFDLNQAHPISLRCDGFDFSQCSSSFDLVRAAVQNRYFDVVFRRCKLPSSWTGEPMVSAMAAVLGRIKMHQCAAGDTNYDSWEEDCFGTIKHETTIVRTGGASDGTTAHSWKMTTFADAEYPLQILRSPEISRWNETTGSSITVTVEIVHDSQGSGASSAFTDKEIWLEVQYFGTSGFPLASFIDDAAASVLASAADQTSSSETWTTTGLTTPVKQKLAVTFTPQEKGHIIAVVCMAGASDTAYVCPKLTIS